jgi:hypothetical protein
MVRDITPRSFLIFALAVSSVGLVATSLFVLYPSSFREDPPWRKPVVGSVFTLICVIGITATFFPKKCAETLPTRRSDALADSDSRRNSLPSDHNVIVARRGHHPSCPNFAPHVITVRTVSLCAACTGLLIGALLALLGTALYFFIDSSFLQTNMPVVAIGQLGIVMGFAQFKFKKYLRLGMNAFFVLGAFLVLVGVDLATKNMFADLYSLIIIVFWILTRISISQWNNRRICNACKSCADGFLSVESTATPV